MAPSKESTPGRASSALQAVAAIERKFGAGAVLRLGDVSMPVTDALPTGLGDLDRAIGIGGWPRGRICEIYGPESSGKTTLALHIVAEAQKAGGVAAYIDAEHAMDADYAHKLGVNVDDLLISQPDSGEQALEIAEAPATERSVGTLEHRPRPTRLVLGRHETQPREPGKHVAEDQAQQRALDARRLHRNAAHSKERSPQ